MGLKWLDVTQDLPVDVEVGNTLTFDYEGSPIHLRIMRKFKGKVWAKEVKLYTPKEFYKMTRKLVKK